MYNTATECYIQILPKCDGHAYSSFYIYLPAGANYYTQYCFYYLYKPADSTLSFSDSLNSQANSSFYRIQSAYIGTLSKQSFSPLFRALQEGELGFAFREIGAGDFSGGIHGDEILQSVSLIADSSPLALDRPTFLRFQNLTFSQTSNIYRCNTPNSKLVLHKQLYSISSRGIKLSQHIEWVADARTLQAAYSPMLTAQRLDPNRPSTILTDTVEFYTHPDGNLVAVIDTSDYGSSRPSGKPDHIYTDVPATAVKVYGKASGLTAETGFHIVDHSIAKEQISSHLWVRFGNSLDNKIYFNISANKTPKAGTVWKSNIYYRLTYTAKQ